MMSSWYSHICLCCVALMSVCACSLNRIDDEMDPKPLVFEVAVSPYTKADHQYQQYPENVPFGVWAATDAGESLLDNAKVVNDSGTWVPENHMMWPDSGLDLLACSPHGRGVADYGSGVVFNDYDLAEGLELMFSDELLGQEMQSNQGKVLIRFNHALSMARFSARATLLGGSVLKIKRIDVGGVATSGSFHSLPSSAWVPGEKNGSMCFFEGDVPLGEEPLELGEVLHVIPQSSNVRISVLCDVVSGDIVLRDQTLTTEADLFWSIGKLESYILKIDAQLNLTIESDNR